MTTLYDRSRKVAKLPRLSQSEYPDLPKIPEGAILILKPSRYRSNEAYIVAAAIIQCCATAGSWEPIDQLRLSEQVESQLEIHAEPYAISTGIDYLLEQGDVEVIWLRNLGGPYFVPKPSLAHKAMRDGSLVKLLQFVEPATEPSAIVLLRRNVMATLRQMPGRLGNKGS